MYIVRNIWTLQINVHALNGYAIQRTLEWIYKFINFPNKFVVHSVSSQKSLSSVSIMSEFLRRFIDTCLSVCPQRGTPVRSRQEGTPARSRWGYPGQAQMGGYPSQVQMEGILWPGPDREYPGQVQMGGSLPPGMGYPPPGTGQQMEYLICCGRYASCVHAGRLSYFTSSFQKTEPTDEIFSEIFSSSALN